MANWLLTDTTNVIKFKSSFAQGDDNSKLQFNKKIA